MSIFDGLVFDEHIELLEFARRCLDAGRVVGVSPHILMAIAHDQSGIKNKALTDDGLVGPFQFDVAEWAKYAALETFDPGIFGADQRMDPFSQCFVAARKVRDIMEELAKVLSKEPGAKGHELYFGWLVGLPIAKTVLHKDRLDANGKRSEKIDVALGAVTPTIDVAATITKYAAIMKNGSNVRTVDDLLEQVALRLDPGLTVAIQQIELAEPGLFSAVSSATDTTTTPWMVLAKQQLDFGIQEPSAEINKYFSETGLGAGHNGATPWCAAFVSWCVMKSTNPPKPLAYSAVAGNWAMIGTEVPPAYGVIGVTHPMVVGTSGHVGFVMRVDDKRVFLLAGNQSPKGGGGDAVCIREYARAKFKAFRMV